MKNFLAMVAQLIFIATVSVAPVYAQTVTQTPKMLREESRQEARITMQQQKLDTRTADLKARADKEIGRRIASLNKLSARLAELKHISAPQKSTFTTEIQTEITTLTTLKTKIDADTDITTLKTDVQSIIKDYRVFALFIPQLELIAAADRVLNVTDEMTQIVTKLQTRITDAQTHGKDVTILQTTLTDMQNKIADAKIQANNAITTVSGLTPTGYPGNASSLQSARKMLQTARLDLVTARKDGESIIQQLKTMKISATPTP